MEQFERATFAQVRLRLRLAGDSSLPVAVVRQDAQNVYRGGSVSLWRIAKRLLGASVPERFRNGHPFHAGPTWAAMEAGVKVMAAAFSD